MPQFNNYNFEELLNACLDGNYDAIQTFKNKYIHEKIFFGLFCLSLDSEQLNTLKQKVPHPVAHYLLAYYESRVIHNDAVARVHLIAAVYTGNLQPQHHFIWHMLGTFYLEGKGGSVDLCKAEELLLKACEVNNQSAYSFLNLALCYEKQGKFEQTKHILMRGIAKDFAICAYKLGSILEKKAILDQDYIESAEYYAKALELGLNEKAALLCKKSLFELWRGHPLPEILYLTLDNKDSTLVLHFLEKNPDLINMVIASNIPKSQKLTYWEKLSQKLLTKNQSIYRYAKAKTLAKITSLYDEKMSLDEIILQPFELIPASSLQFIIDYYYSNILRSTSDYKIAFEETWDLYKILFNVEIQMLQGKLDRILQKQKDTESAHTKLNKYKSSQTTILEKCKLKQAQIKTEQQKIQYKLLNEFPMNFVYTPLKESLYNKLADLDKDCEKLTLAEKSIVENINKVDDFIKEDFKLDKSNARLKKYSEIKKIIPEYNAILQSKSLPLMKWSPGITPRLWRLLIFSERANHASQPKLK